MKRTATAALLTAGVLAAAAGCSSAPADKAKPAPDPTAAVRKAAQDYQAAAVRGDWNTACALSSARLRGGTVADCVAANSSAPAPSPSSSASPSPSVQPPTYADGSTPAPIATPTPTGAQRASVGPITAGAAIAVPASGNHAAGYGVFLSYTVTWPGQAPTADHRAMRLVQEGGAWVVDQHEDDLQREDQLREVLLGGAK
ncbi:hypothetical protein ACFV1L_22235 [Kitasatospora sp. NPDC059646]|uniref:hypothetical protein n=1 Tax=Kitasatospora sp. NPDC059646 TaxID=3346893 RepID=UPI00369A0E17